MKTLKTTIFEKLIIYHLINKQKFTGEGAAQNRGRVCVSNPAALGLNLAIPEFLKKNLSNLGFRVADIY